jgi:DNA-binding transcriptional ArsR family regulator
MDKKTATTIFESLSSEVRLDVFRLLVKKGLDGMVAGEIATALDIPNTNLSFHLKAMTHAGMVNVQQEGRFQRYRANFPLMLETIAYLTEECCSGNPDQCANIRAESSCSPDILPKINKINQSTVEN